MIQYKENNKACFIKCENLQHAHSFKYRGAFAALYLYQKQHPKIWETILKNGVITSGTGNFAKALASLTALQNIKLSVVVHEEVDHQKINSIVEYNPQTEIITVSYEEWKNCIISNQYADSNRFFISPAINDYLTLGYATLGIEILQQLPDISSLIIPYGGGNLTYSLATFLKYAKPDLNVYTVEVNTGAPFQASFKAKQPVMVPYTNSFVDGIGSTFVIPQQFNRLHSLVKDALVVSLDQIGKAMLQVSKKKLIAEGAGAASLAAAMKYTLPEPCCCILSGGSIDEKKFLTIVNQMMEGAEHG